MYKNVTWFSALWLTLLANRQSLQEVLTYFAIVEITETMSSWDHKPISGWWKGSYVKSFFIELTESHDWSNLKSFRLYHIPAKFTWCTMSWELWKHPDPAPGCRPIFFKPEWPKESKNGFKTFSCRPPRMGIFSNYFFRHKKSSKKWHFWTLDGIFEINQKALICLGVFRFEIGALKVRHVGLD